MKRLTLCLLALSLIPLSAGFAAASNDPVNVKEVKVKKDKDKEKSVPEPALLLLLAGAAGVAGARKVWKSRG
jgi:hypothetical protein